MRAKYKLTAAAVFVLIALLACRAALTPPTQPAPAATAGTPTAAGLAVTAPVSTAELTPPLPTQDVSAGLNAALLPDARSDAPDPAESALYNISLEIDDSYLRFDGQLQASVPNNSAGEWQVIYFRLFPNAGKTYGNGRLQVDRVLLEGESLQTRLSVEDTVLEIQLPEPLRPGERITLAMEFHGQVAEDFGSQERPGYGIYNYSEGVLAMSGWYPILAVYDDQGWHLDPVSWLGDSVYSEMAYYSVEVTAPPELVLAATGTILLQEIFADHARYQIETGPVRDFFLALSPDFKLLSREVSGTVVNAYYQTGDEKAASQALQVAVDALQVFNRRFGAYPYAELDIVQAPMRIALGVEYPGIVMVATDLYRDPEQYVFTTAVAHEVAHQWWYNLVGNNVFAEPWLDEGLATYSTAVYYQEVSGQAAYLAYSDTWQKRYERLLQESDDDLPTRDLAYFEQPGKAQIYGAVVYIKSALFFKALREEIGERAFFEGLRSYYEAHHYGVAAGEDLLQAFEVAAGQSLQDLYQQWLYTADD